MINSFKKIVRLGRGFNGWLLRWWNFSTIFKLKPFASIKQKSNEWLWRGSDAIIKLDAAHKVKLHGFYMLEVNYESSSHVTNSQLYVGIEQDGNFGDGFLLPLKSSSKNNGVAKRICYFPGYVDELFWSPSEEPGACKNVSIKLVKLRETKAKSLMLKKLTNNLIGESGDFDARDSSTAKIYESYNQVFNRIEPIFNYSDWDRQQTINQSSSEVSLDDSGCLVSVIVTVCKANAQWLDECLSSVTDQGYSQWQLVIVADKSDSDESHAVIANYIDSHDSRIKVIMLDEFEQVSAKNIGVEEASSEYVLFLNQHDTLSHKAVAEFTQQLMLKKNALLVYSNEDLMKDHGVKYAPQFKPDWNAEALLSRNYIGHSCCYSIKLLATLNGFSAGFHGAEDYDLVLRASALLTNDNTEHLSKSLYHTRIYDNTAHTTDTVDHKDSKIAVLQAHIQREKLNARVKYNIEHDACQIDWQLPIAENTVSILVVVRDDLETFKPLLLNILKVTHYNNFEIIVVDNASVANETLNFLAVMSYDPRVKIIKGDASFNYSQSHNLAVSASESEFICLLGNEIELCSSSWLIELLSIGARQRVGCVGAKILAPDLSLVHGPEDLGTGGYVAHFHKNKSELVVNGFCWAEVRQQVLAVSGSCMLVRRSVISEAGGFDEAYFSAYSDVDLCMRVNELGYKNIYSPTAVVMSNEKQPLGSEINTEDADLFNSRWKKSLQNSTYYCPNFTRPDECFLKHG